MHAFNQETKHKFERSIEQYFFIKDLSLNKLMEMVEEDNNTLVSAYLLAMGDLKQQIEREHIVGKKLLSLLKNIDPYQQITTTENKIHNINLFLPFKFVMEIDSHLTPFKKNIIYETEAMRSEEDTTKNIFSFSRPFLNKIIKYYKKFSFNDSPVIKGKYYLFINQRDDVIASYIISMNHKNNEILDYKKQDGEIKKASFYWLRIVVDIYTDINKEYKTEELCAICYENKSNIIVKPCNHLFMCKRCCTTGKIKNCPICRTEIKQYIKYDMFL